MEAIAQSTTTDPGLLAYMSHITQPDLFYHGHDAESQDDGSGTRPASTSPTFPVPQSSQSPQAGCPCRASLMLSMPSLVSAMKECRLDEIFKVTGDAIRRCQDIMDCKNCAVRCTDLLLIMSVVQETHPCFDRIAKYDLDGFVRVTFGGYEVSLKDGNLRAALVMDLVQRASKVLESISSTGQSMIDQLSEPCPLANANVAYLEATISQFRTVLRCVSRFMEEAISKSSTLPEALQTAT